MGSQKHGDRGYFFFHLKDSQPYNLKSHLSHSFKKGATFLFHVAPYINRTSLIFLVNLPR